MFKKLKEFNNNYANLFFMIALIFIIVFLGYIAFTNRTKKTVCVTPSKILNNYENYAYNIKYTDEDEGATIYIKRYGSKYLLEVNKDENKTNYYIEYTDFLKKEYDDIYYRYNNNYIIDGVDNKYLFLDYINEISLDSTIVTKNERTCYVNRKNNVSMCINLDKSIELSKDNFKLLYTITDLGGVDDFKVSSNLEDFYVPIIEDSKENKE